MAMARSGRAVLSGVVLLAVLAVGTPAPAAGASEASETRIVRGYFTEVLGRAPSAAELDAWRAKLQASGSMVDFARLITRTNTYKTRFIEAGYLRYIRKPPTPDSAAFWLRWINDGHSYDQFISYEMGVVGYTSQYNPPGSTSNHSTEVIRGTYFDLTGD